MLQKKYDFLKMTREDVLISYYRTGQHLPIYNPMLPYYAKTNRPIVKNLAHQILTQIYRDKTIINSAIKYEFDLMIKWLKEFNNC